MMMIIIIIIIVYIRATDWVHVVWLQYNAIIRKIIQIRGVYLGIVVANVIITFAKKQIIQQYNNCIWLGKSYGCIFWYKCNYSLTHVVNSDENDVWFLICCS